MRALGGISGGKLKHNRWRDVGGISGRRLWVLSGGEWERVNGGMVWGVIRWGVRVISGGLFRVGGSRVLSGWLFRGVIRWEGKPPAMRNGERDGGGV